MIIFFKQKTAYEMRISDWSSDVCSSDLEEASGARARQVVKLVAGISKEKATELNKHIKGLNLKGVQSQVQGEQLRVTGKKRDDLQNVIAALREHDFGIPLQFNNFRD